MHKNNSVSIGQLAEQYVADYLVANHYEVIDRNWRNRWCEIDIIAKKKRVIYFVEVRYRKSSNWGSGLETVTPKKHQQMTFAAEIWLNSQESKYNANLAVASVSGYPLRLDDFIVL